MGFLAKGGGSIVLKVAFAILGFATSVVLARMLGASGFGVYAFALSVIMTISLPAQVGLPQLAVRETAKNLAQENLGKMFGFWQWANRLVVTFSLTVAGMATVVLYAFLWGGESERAITIAIGLLSIPLLSWAKVQSGFLRGLGAVVIGQVPENIIKPGLFMCLLIAVVPLAVFSDFGPLQAMMLYVLASLVTFAVTIVLLRRFRPPSVPSADIAADDRAAWRQAVLPLAMIGGLQLVNNYAAIIIMGFTQDDAEVGIFRSVSQLAILIVFGLQALNQVLQPQFSRLWNKGKQSELQCLLTVSARIIFLLALPPAVIFYLFGEEILAFTFGPTFAAGSVALVILTSGQVTNAFGGSVGALLNMTGHEKETLKGITASAMINIVLNLLLIPIYGMEGAAIAAAFSLASWNLILVRKAIVLLRLDATPLGIFTRSG